MSEMIEKVAAAIWRAREEELPPRVRRMEPDELDRSTGAWGHVERMARAAVEAMREPTEEMDTAMRAECVRMKGVIDPVTHIWDVAIDAALAP